jgi:transposase
VQAALKHPRGVGLSDHEIARHVGVDHKTVLNWRMKLAASREIPQIAKHVGVDHKTVSHWRSKLEASWEIPKIATRAVTRKGKTYQQRTDNIGKRARGHREGDRGSDRQAAGAEDG